MKAHTDSAKVPGKTTAVSADSGAKGTMHKLNLLASIQGKFKKHPLV